MEIFNGRGRKEWIAKKSTERRKRGGEGKRRAVWMPACGKAMKEMRTMERWKRDRKREGNGGLEPRLARARITGSVESIRI